VNLIEQQFSPKFT